MSASLTLLTAISLCGLASVLVWLALRQRTATRVVPPLLGVLAFALFLHVVFDFPWAKPEIIPRSGSGTGPHVVVLLYGSMLLGMLAQSSYQRFERPAARRKKFDLGTFLAPFFASPIVFIPLLAALQNADLDLSRMDAARMMIFFVAFQNGFFWKEYFDHRRALAEAGRNAE